MAYLTTELARLHSVEMSILADVMRVCVRHNIEYFIIGGTALGAKRHGGFIPWDDDVDIGMTRENYERFLEIAPNCLSGDHFLQTPFTDPECPLPYAKVRKNGTLFVEWYMRNIKMHHGIFVDIFPYDNIPDAENECRKQYKTTKFWIKLYKWKKTPSVGKRPTTISRHVKAFLRAGLYMALKILPDRPILDAMQRELCRYNTRTTARKACLYNLKYLVESMPNDVLYPLTTVNFEGLDLPAPGDLDAYLTNHYGQYMKLPPPDKREGHKPLLLDFGKFGVNGPGGENESSDNLRDL